MLLSLLLALRLFVGLIWQHLIIIIIIIIIIITITTVIMILTVFNFGFQTY